MIKKKVLSVTLVLMILLSAVFVLPYNTYAADNGSDTLTVNLRDAQFGYFEGFSEQKVFHIGDTFKVYTFLDLSELTECGVSGWASFQSYNSDMLELELESYSVCYPNTALCAFPKAVEEYMDRDVHHYSFSEANDNEVAAVFIKPVGSGAIFDDNTDILTVYTYKVIAPGETTIRNMVWGLGLDDYKTTLIKYFYGPYNHEWDLGEVLFEGIYLHTSFTNPPQTKPVEPVTEEPTALSADPTQQASYRGDANGDGDVDSVDATIIQRVCTMIKVPYDEEQLMRADVDGDGSLSTVDATFIQRHATMIKTPYPIGELIR